MSFTAPAGRMSLTVYIGESVLMSLLYCGYGLGFFGQWGAFAVVLSGIVTWALLSLVAWQWMKRFDQGPLEKIAALGTGKRVPHPTGEYHRRVRDHPTRQQGVRQFYYSTGQAA